jgi:hypothetical protein
VTPWIVGRRTAAARPLSKRRRSQTRIPHAGLVHSADDDVSQVLPLGPIPWRGELSYFHYGCLEGELRTD